ncbi:MAG: hypothetical protein P1P81_09255 [Desulfobulbales bacterium]|nr:hypothetical protein [Desulfobulbales bacterium]
MIFFGQTNREKCEHITATLASGFDKVIIISPTRFRFDYRPESGEWLDWDQVIMYRHFYRLLQEIDHCTVLVINECLRKKNRNDLTYNCIRHYINQAGSVIIFQYLPIIDSIEDFMILYDFATNTRWKHKHLEQVDLTEAAISGRRVVPELNSTAEAATPAETKTYNDKKKKLFAELGAKDPHTLPRNLYLQTGRVRCRLIDSGKNYVGRNNRFKLKNLATYREVQPGRKVDSVFELPHNPIEFNDFIALGRPNKLEILLTDLPVDQFYWNRYQSWLREINRAYAALL